MWSSGDRLIVASDVSPTAGTKMYRTFATPAALAAHLALFPTVGIDPILYEGLLSKTPSRIYNDLDNEVLERNDEAFAVRVRHFELVRDGFLTSVLLIPTEEIAFQSCRANGGRPKRTSTAGTRSCSSFSCETIAHASCSSSPLSDSS
jgi:hypothetical protein